MKTLDEQTIEAIKKYLDKPTASKILNKIEDFEHMNSLYEKLKLKNTVQTKELARLNALENTFEANEKAMKNLKALEKEIDFNKLKLQSEKALLEYKVVAAEEKVQLMNNLVEILAGNNKIIINKQE